MLDFAYLRPRSAEEAVAMQAAHAGARYFAGGTTLYDLMKLGVEAPATVLDITAIEGLRNLATVGGNLLQRTRCSYFRNGPEFACNKREPGSGCAARGGLNRGHALLGGSEACIAVYPGDCAVALIAFDAVVDVLGPRGARAVPLRALHVAPGATPQVETTLAPGELITHIRVPRVAAGRASTYHKIRDRESYAFALVSAAVGLHMEAGRVLDARIALGGVATRPWRADAAERSLVGQPLTRVQALLAARLAFAGAQPLEHNAFKVALGIETVADALMLAKDRS